MIASTFEAVSDQIQFDEFVPQLSPGEQHLRVLELTVQLLIVRAGMGDYWAEGFQEAKNVLAATTLPAAEFKCANRHLQNSICYCHQQEFGAAAFELRILRGHLQSL